jgi:hypothetical protein
MAPNGKMYNRLCFLYRKILGRMGMLNSELWGVCQARQQARTESLQATMEPMEPRLLLSTVVGHNIFYNNSAFDGHNAAINVDDDAAIAPDKTVLVGVGQPIYANVSSYDKGVNGIMLDVEDLPATPTLSDFFFSTFTKTNGVVSWQLAPNPTGIAVRPGAGVDGSDRIVLTWDDQSAVKNAFLQVMLLPSERTGLATADAFYFGSAIGTAVTAEGTTQTAVADAITSCLGAESAVSATIDDPYDFNRDGQIDGDDWLIAQGDSAAAAQETLGFVCLTGTGQGSSSSPPGEGSSSTPARGEGTQTLMDSQQQQYWMVKLLCNTFTANETDNTAGGGGACLSGFPMVNGYAIVPASSGEDAAWQAIHAGAAAIDLGTFQMATYCTPTCMGCHCAAFDIGTIDDLETRHCGFSAPAGYDDGQWLLVLEANYAWSNNIDYDDEYLPLDIHEVPFVINSTCSNADPCTSDATPWTGHFLGENDQGFCLVSATPEVTLHSFIQYANQEEGPQTADFAIPTDDAGYDDGVWVIDDSCLPTVTDTLEILGKSQDGYAGTPVIAVTGSGFQFLKNQSYDASNSKVSGLSLVNYCTAGVAFQCVTGGTVEDTFIGLWPDETAGSLTSQTTGLHITNSSNIVATNLIIGANDFNGVCITGTTSTGNRLMSSRVGITDTDAAVGNHGDGVLIAYGACGNTIGVYDYQEDSEGNIISNNCCNGVEITGSGTRDNWVTGNCIDGNCINGVLIAAGACCNIIGVGDGDDAESNDITNNCCNGVKITGSGTIRNLVAGNLVSTNSGDGVLIACGACCNTIGTADADTAESNTICNNFCNGVEITGSGTNCNWLAGNTVTSNGNDGVLIAYGACGNTVGVYDYEELSEGNVISHNCGNGVEITCSGTRNNWVSGNCIDANWSNGVLIAAGACCNTIGVGCGDDAESNDISNNCCNGLVISGSNTRLNWVAGNVINANCVNGVLIEAGAHHNTIGTQNENETEGNDICSNCCNGVIISGSGTCLNWVAGNVIDANCVNGVLIEAGANHNTIGTQNENETEGNDICGNCCNGVMFSGSGTCGNWVAGNVIDANCVNGVMIEAGAHHNTIGTQNGDYTEGNDICSNCCNGVVITGSGTCLNWLAGNVIDANRANGVLIEAGACCNTIGVGDGDTAESNDICCNGCNGVQISGSGTTRNLVVGNRINGNCLDGVVVCDSARCNTIGVHDANEVAEGNLISNNCCNGVEIAGSGTCCNWVAGNCITTNQCDGVLIAYGAASNIIGTNGDESWDFTEENCISSNCGNGVRITGGGTSGNRVAYNNILSNLCDGVAIESGASENIIGTNGDEHSDWCEGNIIIGNTHNGVRISGEGTSCNRIAGNCVGWTGCGNGCDGVLIESSATQNIVGTNSDNSGDDAEGNLILGNAGNGVEIYSSSSNRVVANCIGADGFGYGVGNGHDGVLIWNGGGNSVRSNAIGGNSCNGVEVCGSCCNCVVSNLIGVTGSGSAAANGGDGVLIEYSQYCDGGGNLVGCNTIAGNSGNGVGIVGSPCNYITCNCIGITASGSGLANGGDGVLIEYSQYSAGDGNHVNCNTIAHNSRNGVEICGNCYTWVQENFIGTTSGNAVGVGNGCDGVLIQSRDGHCAFFTVVGCNVIAGNCCSGVEINAGVCTQVSDNCIGLAACNGGDGVLIEYGASRTLVQGNTIAGNWHNGVKICGSSCNDICFNCIGTEPGCAIALGNCWDGVFISGDSNTVCHNTIARNCCSGVEICGACCNSVTNNSITINCCNGVAIEDGTRNAIRQNGIFCNGELGIDLGDDGLTVNDAGDPDSGANNLQNRPLLSGVTVGTNSHTTITGSLNSTSYTTFTIEFFANTATDDRWWTHGRTYLDSITVSTNENGIADFTKEFDHVVENITATATDSGDNTSEVGWGIAVMYRPTGEGTTGQLDHLNPNGTGGTPSFQGGYRVFPDATSYTSTTTSHNVVRIRAILPPEMSGECVYFRSFDVDDPSNDYEDLDPNGWLGNDNYGTFTNDDCDQPGTSFACSGYRGRLRRVLLGASWEAEGCVVDVQACIDSTGEAWADVDLATTFSPGDNFRVLASLEPDALSDCNINDATFVPTSGVVTEFAGAATEQLSVWRHVHVEQDTMAATEGDTQCGHWTCAAASVDGLDVITTDINIEQADSYEGGIFCLEGVNYHIVANGYGPNATVTIVANARVYPKRYDSSIVIYQDDWFVPGDMSATSQTGHAEASSQPVAGTVALATNITITVANRYVGGLLRVNGVAYVVTAHGTGTNASVTVESSTALAGGDCEVYVALGTGTPSTRVDTTDDAHLYDAMQASTVLARNRYAAAYLEPEYHDLDACDSHDVVSFTHVSSTSLFQAMTNIYRGSAAYETNLYWVVYCTTAFEYTSDSDGDPQAYPEVGITGGVTLSVGGWIQASQVYLEAIRDMTTAANMQIRDYDSLRGIIAAHEIGHQFGLDDREDSGGLMGDIAQTTVCNSLFTAMEVSALRHQVGSPG